MEERTLKQLLAQARDGDREALRALYQELSVPLYTYLYRMTGRRTLAEDALQDTFVKLSRPGGSAAKAARAYIYRAARNAALDILRKEGERAAHREPEGRGFEAESVLRMDVEEALAALPGDMGQIVTLHASAGLTFGEIGKVMGLSTATVFRRYKKGVDLLRERL